MLVVLVALLIGWALSLVVAVPVALVSFGMAGTVAEEEEAGRAWAAEVDGWARAAWVASLPPRPVIGPLPYVAVRPVIGDLPFVGEPPAVLAGRDSRGRRHTVRAYSPAPVGTFAAIGWDDATTEADDPAARALRTVERDLYRACPGDDPDRVWRVALSLLTSSEATA